MQKNSGSALALVLSALLVIGIVVGGIFFALRAPLGTLADVRGRFAERVELESRLERARAAFPEEVPDAEFQWIDSCHVIVSARSGNLDITETWSVLAPALYVAWSDTKITGTVISPVFEGDAGCDTFVYDTAVILPIITRTLMTNEIRGMLIAREAVHIRPAESGPIVLHDVELEEALLFVEGDVIISGTFKGKARDGWPLVVVTGNVGSLVHEETWEWEGAFISLGDIFLSGPVLWKGTILGKAITFFGVAEGSLDEEGEVPLGLEPRIKTVERNETLL